MHWGNDSFYGPGIDISVLERILGIQKIVLGHCLSSSTLARLQNQQLQADPGTDPLRMDEVFRSLTDGIWSDLDKLPDPKDAEGRQDRPLDHPPQPPARIPAAAEQHGPRRSVQLRPATRSATSSSSAAATRRCRPTPAPWPGCTSRRSPAGSAWSWRPGAPASTTRRRAHLEESKHRIAKVLEANLDIKEP